MGVLATSASHGNEPAEQGTRPCVIWTRSATSRQSPCNDAALRRCWSGLTTGIAGPIDSRRKLSVRFRGQLVACRRLLARW